MNAVNGVNEHQGSFLNDVQKFLQRAPFFAEAVFRYVVKAKLGGIEPEILADNERHAFTFDLKPFPVRAVRAAPAMDNLIGNRADGMELAHIPFDCNVGVAARAIVFDAAPKDNGKRGNLV